MKKINIFLSLILFISFFNINADSIQYQLYKAICNDSEQEIDDVIKNGADINEYLDGVNSYPLKFAIVRGKEKAVEILLFNDAIIPYDESGDLVSQYQTLSYTASKLSNPKVYFLILQKIMTYGDNWIPWCHSVYVEYIKNLIKQGKIEQAIYGLRIGNKFLKNTAKIPFVVNFVDHNKKYQQIIMEDVFALLEKKDANINLFLNLLQELINVGYNVNHIWTICTMGYHNHWLYQEEAILEFALKNGASASKEIVFRELNYKHFYRRTYPIFQAIYVGNIKAVKILLDHYASANQVLSNDDYYNLKGLSKDRFMGDKTPFCYAREFGRDDIVELLLSYGAEI